MSDRTCLDIEMSGGCQCGAVRFHVTELMADPHICYCRMCQKATGNLLTAAVGVQDAHLTWTRGATAVFASSDFVERGFCRDCGTPLFFHYIGAPFRALTIGSFDDPKRIPIFFDVGTEGKHPALAGFSAPHSMGATEDIDAAGAARIAACNHQHPDHDTETWPPAS